MRARLPTEIIHAIRLATWRALFAARGAPSSARKVPVRLDTHDAIAAALRACDLPLPLARALFTVAAFATEAGRTDIYLAARALAYAPRWPEASSPADLVALLLAASPTDAAVAAVLDAAQTLRDRAFRSLATYLYVGSRARDPQVGEPSQYLEPWRAALESWARHGDFGDVTSVDASAAKGVLRYELAHEDRRDTRLHLEAPLGRAKPRLATITVRPIRSHEVLYEPASARLSIITDCAEAVTPLARMAGRVLFDDETHFFTERAFDLWTLQELGAASLTVPALADRVSTTAIGGTWHSGKNHAITPRGLDFFAALRRYKIRIEGGRLDQITLRARQASRRDGPPSSDIALRPPHLLTFSEPELAPLLRELLDHARITNPAPRVRDFFSLQPWIAPAADWIASEGEEGFARLVELGILVADRTNRAIAPPDDPHAGRIATAYPLRDGRFLACSADATIAPFVVKEEDLIVYALSFARLAALIAGALGLDGPASSLDDDGVLYCGRRTIGPTHVLVSLLTRPIRAATGERLREAAEHGHAIVIAPEGRAAEHGLRQVAMPALSGAWRPLLGAIVRALHVESYVDTTMYAPPGARVVLHRATMRVWIDGVLCEALTENHFRLLDILVTHAGQPVHTKDIAERVAQGRPHDDTTRKAVDSLALFVEKSFHARGLAAPADIRTFIRRPRRGFYALSAPGFAD